MKKTQLKDAIRNIFKRKVAFLSMLLTIAIGVGGVLCIFFSTAAMKNLGTDAYIKSDFRDFELAFSYGITAEEVDDIQALSGVTEAEGVFSIGVMLEAGDTTLKGTVVSETKRVNVPELVSGSMPELSTDCVILDTFARDNDLKIGDRIRLHPDSDSLKDLLKWDEFRITGTVIHPNDFSRKASPIIVVNPSAFDTEVTHNGFTSVYTLLNVGDRTDMFSPAYLERVNEVEKQVRPLLNLISEERYHELKDEAYVQLNAEKQRAKTELKKGRRKLKKARKKMNRKFTEAEQKLEEAERQISDSEDQLNNRINSKQTQIDLIATIGFDTSSMQGDLNSTEANYRYQINAAKQKLAEKRREFKKKKKAALKKYNNGKKTYQEKKLEAETKLAEAEQQIENMKKNGVLIQSSRMNACFESLYSAINSVSSVALFFSILFVLISSIVFFSTIAITIEEQKKQVGTIKALGFRSDKIRKKYLFFGVSAAVLGCAAGVGLSQLLESPIVSTIQNGYALGEAKMVLSIPMSLAISLGAIVLVYVVVRVACKNLLRCSAIGLMSGNEPAVRGRNTAKKKDRKRSLYSELILNNIRMDIKRVIVGITVIAAGVIIIGLGLTLKESFSRSVDVQLEDLDRYDMRISVCESIPDEVLEDLNSVIAKSGAYYAPAYNSGVAYKTGRNVYGTTLISMDKNDFPIFFEDVDHVERGVAISNSMHSFYGMDEGDEFTLFNGSLEERKAEITQVASNYLGTRITMTSEYYKEIFGTDVPTNSIYIRFAEADREALNSALTDRNTSFAEYITITTPEDMRAATETTKKLFMIICYVMIGLATAMCMLIMINLTNIMVSHRMKDILVMRVNGFSMKKVRGYLMRETIVTNGLGMIIGVGLGIFLKGVLLQIVSSANYLLNRSASVIPWLIAVGMSLCFTFLTNAISFRSIKKTPLTDVTKY